MTLARIVFEKKKLEQRYGVEGKAAGHYVEAGFSVRMGVETPSGRLSFVAKKEGMILAALVVNGSVAVKPEDVRRLVDMARAVSGKPLLILYGSGPRMTQEALEEAKKQGVAVRRLR